MVLWPGEVFAGHVVPSGGKATEIAADLDKFFKDRPGIDISGTQVLISDGCEKMLGWKTGVNASFEKLMGRRFLRVICFFHHIELSFTVIIKLYGNRPGASNHYARTVLLRLQSDKKTRWSNPVVTDPPHGDSTLLHNATISRCFWHYNLKYRGVILTLVSVHFC